MEVSYATMIAIGTLVQRLGRDARRLERALAETMNASAEWKRIADELKAERDAEREQHAETARLLNLRAECDDLRRVFLMVHGSLGIQQGEHIGNAIDALKKERDDLTTRLRQSIARGDFAEMRLATLAAELDTERERHKTTPAPRSHPVEAGEYVKNDCGEVCQVREVHAEYLLTNGWSWDFEQCTPCDPPQEASHITPEGKRTAEGALPQPGDIVRLVREPSADTVGDTLKNSLDWPWESRWGCVGDRGEVVESAGTMPGARMVRIMNTGVKVWWPLSCVEVVKGADK